MDTLLIDKPVSSFNYSLFGVKYTSLLEHFCHNGHSGVDRVGNNQDASLRAVLGHGGSEVAHDSCVNLKRSKYVSLSECK